LRKHARQLRAEECIGHACAYLDVAAVHDGLDVAQCDGVLAGSSLNLRLLNGASEKLSEKLRLQRVSLTISRVCPLCAAWQHDDTLVRHLTQKRL